MAVHDWVPGLVVGIKVCGLPAKEYDDPNGEVQGMDWDDFDLPAGQSRRVPYVIKCIEAEPGASYSVSIIKEGHLYRASHHIARQLTIDGDALRIVHNNDSPGSDGQRRSYRNIDGRNCGNPTDGYQ